MIELQFEVEGAAPLPYSVAPQLGFKVRVTQRNGNRPIHSIALACQIRIELARRRFTDNERVALEELFGQPERWGQTLRPMLWTHANTVVSSFTETCVVDLPVPCTFDFNVAATKLFYGLEQGDVPVCFLFNGTVFYANEKGALQIAQVPWDSECNFRLPIDVWKQMMELYYPNSAWLTVRRDIFDRLCKYKREQQALTWEQAFERLLTTAPADVQPLTVGPRT